MTQNLNYMSIYDLFLTGSITWPWLQKHFLPSLFQRWHEAISATFTFQHSLDWDLKGPFYSSCIAAYFCLPFGFKYLQMVSCLYQASLHHSNFTSGVIRRLPNKKLQRWNYSLCLKKGKGAAIRFLWEPVPTHLGDQDKGQLTVLQQQPFLRVI